ncbi:M23 family metallopeptidase [Ornithinimicrobium flavum]|uniref:M23 family metallopeptidase n=1 Tax=Ornithinimicrobium flavum TaxID=1288636 RepID=UPI00106F67F5|nr:M23 family metallopeptidase [Ornithinimicrobium flavum]
MRPGGAGVRSPGGVRPAPDGVRPAPDGVRPAPDASTPRAAVEVRPAPLGGGKRARRALTRWVACGAVVVGQLLAGALPGTAVAGPDRPAEQRAGVWASTLLGIREQVPVSRPAGREETAAWGWPLAGRPSVVRGFDPPARRWLPGHRGIDLAGIEGEAVLAVADGVVTFSGEVAGVGVVSVTHASGLRSTYQPVSEAPDRGQRVRRGARIGGLEASGSHCAPRVCLHLGAVRDRDTYVDPTPLLLGVELTLLPVGP